MAAVDASERELFGWYVELGGRRVAELTDPKPEDMFWVSYAVSSLPEDEPTRNAVFADEFWKRPDLVYRNRVTGEVPPNAFQGGPPPSNERPRVAMRALYSSLTPSRYERLLLWLRRRRRRSDRSVVP